MSGNGMDFKDMIHYTVNFFGPEDSVAECRRYLASCPEGGSYSMFDVDRIIPLPKGIDKNSFDAKLYRSLNYGCDEFCNVREYGMNTISFGNGDYLMDKSIFTKIVEKFPDVKIAVIEGRDTEMQHGSIITRHEVVDGEVISDIILHTANFGVLPVEEGNMDVKEASYLKHFAGKTMYGVFLNEDESRACNMRDGTMMYPDGSVQGLSKDENLEIVNTPSRGRYRDRGSLQR